MDNTDIEQRKVDHLTITCNEDVGFHSTTTLFEQVRFVHDALPDLCLDDLDTSVNLLGKRLRAPIIIAAMTGGSAQAGEFNLALARLAQARGYGMGLGSQRAMIVRPELTSTYQVRAHAPDILLLGNIGMVQARGMHSEQIAGMVDKVGADALCVHLNPAQELVQPEGDRDFSGGQETFSRLVKQLPFPIVAKETGCGIGFGTAQRLAEAGVSHVDVSGAGGTSWVAVESKRSTGQSLAVAELMREWGIPTCASIRFCAHAGVQNIIATGGVSNGLQVAKALALGATAVGIARPVLQALSRGGETAALELMLQIERELQMVMLLTGSRTVADLRKVPLIFGSELQQWFTAVNRKSA